MPIRGAFAAGIILLLAFAAQPAVARGQLQAGPTLLEISPGGTSTRLTLRNTGDMSVAAQVRVYAWDQRDGDDRLVPTEDLAVSPPILELQAGGEQLVRLIRLVPVPENRDGSYRVVVDELPGAETGGSTRVHLRMRYVIPVFVRSPDSSPAALSCTLQSGERLICENRGGRAAQLGASSLHDSHGTAVYLSDGLFGYVLPASRRVWDMPSETAGLEDTALRLETQLNGQPETLSVDRAP